MTHCFNAISKYNTLHIVPLEKELTPGPYKSNICMSHLSQDTHTQECKAALEKLEHAEEFLRKHIHHPPTPTTFPFFSRASPFQWASTFVNELKQEPGTDSWVLTPHSVRAEQRSYHRKQKSLMSEVKHGAYAAKVKPKELAVLPKHGTVQPSTL